MRKLKSTERPVLPTPFDDVDDGPPVTKVDPQGWTEPEETPSGIKLKHFSAWVCKDFGNCPGRKPVSYEPPTGGQVRCECGNEMILHGWTKKTRF